MARDILYALCRGDLREDGVTLGAAEAVLVPRCSLGHDPLHLEHLLPALLALGRHLRHLLWEHDTCGKWLAQEG